MPSQNYKGLQIQSKLLLTSINATQAKFTSLMSRQNFPWIRYITPMIDIFAFTILLPVLWI
ncbi:hypothetical protein BDFB_007685 [Asbolus verrucosus]|uniref:Uncharacterized protein n=1 Tax=Asbolus verrucosus TaxID=1661398 RepID=A0A482V8B6_ASBVE|nr:hypothetical protein BDFB_007685 [Asbolus verrucosus]